jgi:hypothetical protein
MMNLLFRLFLAFNSTALLLVVYLIKMGITIPFVPHCIAVIPNYVSYCLYIFLFTLLTPLALFLTTFLGDTDIEEKTITNVESANDAFLPSYLGYFFVALDVPNGETLFFAYLMIFAFTFLSQTLYFNPMFLIFGYHFYNLTTSNNVRVFMITKKQFKDPNNLGFPFLKRINDFTFIDNEIKKT